MNCIWTEIRCKVRFGYVDMEVMLCRCRWLCMRNKRSGKIPDATRVLSLTCLEHTRHEKKTKQVIWGMHGKSAAYLGSEGSNVALPFLDKQANLCQFPFRCEIYTRELNAEGITTFSSKILPVTVSAYLAGWGKIESINLISYWGGPSNFPTYLGNINFRSRIFKLYTILNKPAKDDNDRKVKYFSQRDFTYKYFTKIVLLYLGPEFELGKNNQSTNIIWFKQKYSSKKFSSATILPLYFCWLYKQSSSLSSLGPLKAFPLTKLFFLCIHLS